jgi:hypothetical protein
MKFIRNTVILLFLLLLFHQAGCLSFIPMDDTQKNHLKAHGIAYWS